MQKKFVSFHSAGNRIEAMFPNTKWAAFIKTLNGIRTKVAHIDRKSKKPDPQEVTFNSESIYAFTGISDLLVESRETSKILWTWTEQHFKPLTKKVQGWQHTEILIEALRQLRKKHYKTKEIKSQ